MSDRELLEAAARAAGHNEQRWFLDDCFQVRRLDRLWEDWNPLTSDADAFRLAVAHGMEVDTSSDDRIGVNFGKIGVREWVRGDRFAATRRAIVRAIVELTSPHP